jgi:hypothetical protein
VTKRFLPVIRSLPYLLCGIFCGLLIVAILYFVPLPAVIIMVLCSPLLLIVREDRAEWGGYDP